MEFKTEVILRGFWLSFIDMVDVLLGIVFACRAGKCDLLLEYIRKVIPYAFAYDHVNYALLKWCSSTMLEFLETTHHKGKLSGTYLEIYFGTSDGCCWSYR